VHDRGQVDGDQPQVVLERDVPGEVAVDADAGVEGRGVLGVDDDPAVRLTLPTSGARLTMSTWREERR
jgi:hypothetical protein